jgi:HEAT repeat protein
MINYYIDIVIKTDILLLIAFLSFSAILVIYIIIRDARSKNRIKKLLAIKHEILKLLFSGKKTCLSCITKATAGDFLDVMTNRQRYSVFFNESEQKIFKECFVSAGKIKTLKSLASKRNEKWRRIEAIAALGYTQDDSAMDTLRESLRSKDEDISYFSALAIGRISTLQSVSVLMNFLKSTPAMRRKAASILESLSPNIADEMIKFADDEDPEVRLWTTKLLSKSMSKKYIKKVEALTNDLSPDVRAAACESLAKLQDKDSKELLVKHLNDENWFVRMHAVRALSSIFGQEAIPEIIHRINDGSLLVLDSVRQAIADNIEGLLPYISKLFRGTDELSKKICAEAIDQSGHRLKPGLDLLDKLVRDQLLESIKAYDPQLIERILPTE